MERRVVRVRARARARAREKNADGVTAKAGGFDNYECCPPNTKTQKNAAVTVVIKRGLLLPTIKRRVVRR
jgi:hypothetical protein